MGEFQVKNKLQPIQMDTNDASGPRRSLRRCQNFTWKASILILWLIFPEILLRSKIASLIESGADPSICNLLGVNALGVATRGGHDKIVDALFEHDVHLQKGFLILVVKTHAWKHPFQHCILDEIYDGMINPLHLGIGRLCKKATLKSSIINLKKFYPETI